MLTNIVYNYIYSFHLSEWAFEGGLPACAAVPKHPAVIVYKRTDRLPCAQLTMEQHRDNLLHLCRICGQRFGRARTRVTYFTCDYASRIEAFIDAECEPRQWGHTPKEVLQHLLPGHDEVRGQNVQYSAISKYSCTSPFYVHHWLSA